MSDFAKALVERGIIKVPGVPGDRFPGRNGAPGMAYVADIRGAMADPDQRELIVERLAKQFRRDFTSADTVGCVAKAGIAWGSILAWQLGLPAVTVHLDGPRKSGLQRQIEGSVAGRRVVLIDNLTRTHSSLISAALLVKAEGGTVEGAMAVIGLETGPAGFRVSTLCSEEDLEREGLLQGVLSPEHLHGPIAEAAATQPAGRTKNQQLKTKET
ncbi:orotate phosphoribosyltransferase [Neorhizobium galegae]|uniref:orotate phosphoribosyltransferase n=1 Tax=Neorhizobium galegae TaxID=399 RepID=UPI001AE0EEB6|nr:phosphoribosyltransferase family protein [Neorhizobium galegae]MBP2560090.1 orotate phosphoribosyltransferase [Neorhizobium galegae]